MYKFANGDVFTGSFVNDAPNGEGIFRQGKK